MKSMCSDKFRRLEQLSTTDHVISALAIDQRDSLRKMIAAHGGLDDVDSSAKAYKVAISEELTPYASSILLDPEYGIEAAKRRHPQAGLLMSYEVSGYDSNVPGRFPKLLKSWSVKRLKEAGVDAAKILLYYDIDEGDEVNDQKHAFIERVGSECQAEGLLFFLEIVSYDANIKDSKSAEYAKVKPRKVIEPMKIFSQDRYGVDVLKMEVPVNMKFVEGYNGDNKVIYSQEEAAQFFRDQDAATHLPYIYLSAGVSMDLFEETLRFSKKAGTSFNGVLCGRATWKDSVPVFVKEGNDAARAWMASKGKENIERLGAVLNETASPWTNKVQVENI